MAETRTPAQWYALLFGATFCSWGSSASSSPSGAFITGDQVLWLVPVDTADNLLHLAIAAVGIIAGLASPTRRVAERRPRTA